MQTFAALGEALRGKKILVSISPTWFFGRRGRLTMCARS
jgi:hypothetical protein